MAKDRQDTRALIFKAGKMWAAMMLLLCGSIAAAFLLDGIWATAVPLLCSILTATIVATAFMEFPKADIVSRISACVALAFLAVLFTLTFTDDLTRSHVEPGFGAAPEE